MNSSVKKSSIKMLKDVGMRVPKIKQTAVDLWRQGRNDGMQRL